METYPESASEWTAPAQRSLRIVIADDEFDTVRTLMALLRDEGHQVLGAHTGRDALEALKHFDADAVILDIGMPDLNGWEVAREIRELRGWERPLLIAITGRYTKSADRIFTGLTGFNHYLAKPYATAALLALLAPLP